MTLTFEEQKQVICITCTHKRVLHRYGTIGKCTLDGCGCEVFVPAEELIHEEASIA